VTIAKDHATGCDGCPIAISLNGIEGCDLVPDKSAILRAREKVFAFPV
jgi:hypothetical protein